MNRQKLETPLCPSNWWNRVAERVWLGSKVFLASHWVGSPSDGLVYGWKESDKVGGVVYMLPLRMSATT